MGLAISSPLVAVGAGCTTSINTHMQLQSQLELKSQLVGAQPHLWTRSADGAILEHHGHDGRQRQTSIGKLRVQLRFLENWILNVLAVDQAVGTKLVLIEPLFLNLCEGKHESRRQPSRLIVWLLVSTKQLKLEREADHLAPTQGWHLGERSKTVWNVGELDTRRRRDVAGPLVVLRDDVADARQHADAAVLNLDTSAPLELGSVAVGCEASRVPKSSRWLHTDFVLERVGTEPHLWPSCPDRAVLEHHCHDRSHCQSSISKLRVQLGLLENWVFNVLAVDKAVWP